METTATEYLVDSNKWVLPKQVSEKDFIYYREGDKEALLRALNELNTELFNRFVDNVILSGRV